VIVLDENTIQESIIVAIEHWYAGRVCVIGDLRPHTLIKDEAIPALLIRERQPTFLTTNVTDFWQKMAAHDRYCIVCLPLPNERQPEIPGLLRRLLRLPLFKTKAARMGKVVRVSATGVRFYQVGNAAVQTLLWEPTRRRKHGRT